MLSWSVFGISDTSPAGSKRQPRDPRPAGGGSENRGERTEYGPGQPPNKGSKEGLRVPKAPPTGAKLAGNVLPEDVSLKYWGNIPLLAKSRWRPKRASSCRKSATSVALKRWVAISPQPISALSPPPLAPGCCVMSA